MIWPGTLVSVSLMNAMYAQNDKPDPTVFGGNMPRYRWFGMVTLASFLYYFIPGFLAKFLSVFAFPTWIAPDNVVVNQLFGGVTGLSILPITFDWTQVAGFVGSPLIPPWYVTHLLIPRMDFRLTRTGTPSPTPSSVLSSSSS